MESELDRLIQLAKTARRMELLRLIHAKRGPDLDTLAGLGHDALRDVGVLRRAGMVASDANHHPVKITQFGLYTLGLPVCPTVPAKVEHVA